MILFKNEIYEKETEQDLIINDEIGFNYFYLKILRHSILKILSFFQVNPIFFDKVNEPEQNLFIWAMFLNRIEIAKIFWQYGDVKFRKNFPILI